jgi:hypothetical protein
MEPWFKYYLIANAVVFGLAVVCAIVLKIKGERDVGGIVGGVGCLLILLFFAILFIADCGGMSHGTGGHRPPRPPGRTR